MKTYLSRSINQPIKEILDSEPFRRELAWTRQWLFQGWGLVWLLLAVVTHFLMRTPGIFLRDISLIHFVSISASSLIQPGIILSFIFWMILSPIVSMLRSPYLLIEFGVCIYLLHRRSLVPLTKGRLGELLATPIALDNYLPALLTAPLIWIMVFIVILKGVYIILILITSHLIGVPPEFHTTFYYLWNIFNPLMLGVTHGLVMLTSIIFTFWRILSKLGSLRVFIYMAVVYYVFLFLSEAFVNIPPFLLWRPSDSQFVFILWVILSHIMMWCLLGLIVIRYLHKLRSPAARERLEQALV